MSDVRLPRSPEALLANRAWIRALARSLILDESRADDVEQQTWLSAIENGPGDGGSTGAWLSKVVRNWARRLYRSESRRARHELAAARPEAVSVGDLVVQAEIQRHLADALLALAEPHRATVLLRFFDDLPPREIAKRMDVPVETVKTRLKRGLAELRKRLDAEYGGDGKAWGIALLPLVWKGGVIVKGTTKVAIAVAATLLVAASVGVWTWTRPAPTTAIAPPADTPAVAAAIKPAPSTPTAKPHVDSASVAGEVWRRSPETPAAGVVVRLTSDGRADESVVADARGRFRFDDLPAGTRGTVRIETDSEAVVPAAVAPLLPGESRSTGILWLAPSGTLDVLVTTLDGTPISAARVEARSFGVAYPGVTVHDPAVASATWRDLPDPVAAATTDAVGRATLRGLARGRWGVDASKSGFVSGFGGGDVGAPAGAPPVRVVLAPGEELAGRVEDRAGRPVPGVIVRAHGADAAHGAQIPTPRATTEADGRFTLTGVAAGAISLSVARRGEPPTVVGTFRVPTSSPVRLVIGGPTISGRVVDAATGAPVAGARVRAHAEPWTEAVTDAEGAYALLFLAERVYVNEIRVEKAGYVMDGGPRRDPRGIFNLTRDESARLDVKLRRADGLRGTVSHAGAPVRGARVAGLRGSPLGIQSVATITDGDGRYVLDGVAGTTLLVQVQAPGLLQPDFPLVVFGPLTSGKRDPKWSVDVPAAGGAALDIEMVAGDEVSGRVLGPGDAPIEGALVGVGAAWTNSAADGAFALSGVDLRGTVVSASKEGFAPARVKPDSAPVTIRLAPMSVVRGAVRAEGGPLEDGWVEWAVKPVVQETYYQGAIDQPPPPVQWDRWRAPVAADGTFEVAVTAGTILLRAGGRGHGPSAPVEVTVKEGGPPPQATIDVAAVVTIRGRVVAEDGAAVAGASVEFDRPRSRSGHDDGRPVLEVIAAVSATDGRFEIPSAVPGAHRLFVDADGFMPATVDAASAAEEVVVRLAAAAEVRGTIAWSDGRPVDLAMITLYTKGSPSPFGARGSFRTPYFSGAAHHGSFRVVVPPGTYTALVSASENNAAVGQRTFEDVRTGATDTKFVIDLGATIGGRVVAADDGAPLARASVSIFVEGGKYVAGVTSDDQGRFTAEAVAAGPFAIVALSASGDRSYSSGFVADKRYLRGVVHGVNAGAADVELRLPVGADIAGSLVDASGAPVVGRWVVAHRLTKDVDDQLHDDGWQDRGARTDAAGKFVVTGLVADNYRLFAGEEQGPRRTPLGGGESVASGARDVRVVLPGTASIAGRVVDETGAAFAGVSVSAKPADGSTFYTATTQADGAFEIVGVAAFGTYEVSAGVNERAPIRATDVAPGTSGIVLRLTRGLHASGRVLDAAGKPLPRATLIFKIESGHREAQIVTDVDGRFTIDNLLPGAYRVENFVFRDGKGVYVPCGGLKAGDEGVEIRRSE
jgi:RNA polymerase sigma factor (sigma-70 family)